MHPNPREIARARFLRPPSSFDNAPEPARLPSARPVLMGRGRRAIGTSGRHVVKTSLRARLRSGASVAPAVLAALWTAAALAQPIPATRPAESPGLIAPAFVGRNVDAVRVSGNVEVPTSLILNRIRTREGEPLDPATVEEDYKRIFELKRFSNVEATVEPTDTGVVVSFIVHEQRQISRIAIQGNQRIDTQKLLDVLDLKTGESIDPFRIALARQSIERLYREQNYPFVQVATLQEPLTQRGELVFSIVEGQKVRVRRVAFEGNASFSNYKLRGQVGTSYYIWILRPGELDYEQLEDDVAALRRFYEQKGFFDVRIGRKVSFSEDLNDAQVTFLIDEGPRYRIDRVLFEGASVFQDKQLRENLRLRTGEFYDHDVVQRDVRELVRVYSPHGYVYQSSDAANPDYLQINAQPVYRREAGKLDLIYHIHEGKPYRTGRILVNGNYKTQDKVILREMRVAPGESYNSAEIANASERLRGLGYFSAVNITPIGEESDTRDILVEIEEARTASFNIGAGVSSNGGVAGEISYEQRNFDIGNGPEGWGDILSDRTFTGAGQTFRAYASPSSTGTSAGIRFVDPYLFDQPYVLSNDLYYRQRSRSDWDETRAGLRTSIGRRFGHNLILSLNMRAEDVTIDDIEDPPLRAIEVLDAEGHTTVLGFGPSLRYDTTNRGPLLYRGIIAQAGYEYAFGSDDVQFNKITAGLDTYLTLYSDLFDRRTVLALHVDGGYIDDVDAPIFERFYAGGLGSVRGFRFRGISPRSGIDEDPVGGSFTLLSSAELSYPVYAEMIRGVFFVDAGTVEREVEFTTYRVAAGFGIRIVFPFAQQAPLALDFGFPVVEDDQDDTQLVSFSFGISY